MVTCDSDRDVSTAYCYSPSLYQTMRSTGYASPFKQDPWLWLLGFQEHFGAFWFSLLLCVVPSEVRCCAFLSLINRARVLAGSRPHTPTQFFSKYPSGPWPHKVKAQVELLLCIKTLFKDLKYKLCDLVVFLETFETMLIHSYGQCAWPKTWREMMIVSS